jgi:hypothetical protein
MSKQNVVSTERPSSKLIGLGQAPSNQIADGVLQCGFTNVPVIEYVTWTTNVPLTDNEIDQTFGDEIDVLQNPKTVPGIDSVDSSFIVNGILQADMVAYGFGVHIFAEPQSFTQIGNALVPAPAAPVATPVSPDVFTANDVQVLGLPAGSTLQPAILTWGHDDWEASWHLANAYQFQWRVYQRILLVNELAADVCYFGPYAETVAAGTSETDVIEYTHQVNARYRVKNGGGTFIPLNSRRIGSVNTGAGAAPPTGVGTGTAGNVGIFHPTRDFDLAPVTLGGVRNQGSETNGQPFRKLPRPVLLEKGIPIGMTLNVQDQYHQTQMQRYLSISESTGGNLATVTIDANVLGTTPAPTAAVAYMPELTLDTGANEYSGQQVTTSRVKMKGGTIKVAILIKGIEVWGPWKDYIVRNMSNYVSCPGSSGSTSSGMNGLPGLPR